MPHYLNVAVSQARTLSNRAFTLAALEQTARHAARKKIDLVLFPEAYLGGYPRTCNFGAAVGSRNEFGREQFLQYFQEAVDLGDTPHGAGDDWTERKLLVAKGNDVRGDGVREALERTAHETGVFLVVGLVEKAGGSLYCSVVYVDPARGCIGKRRKVMPTGTERLVWAQGSPSTLKAVTAKIKGVGITLAAAICWENYMPLLRHSLYSQNVNIYLAPTADARDTWLPLMRTIALEGRTFVLSANQCTRESDLPKWITSVTDETSSSAGKADDVREARSQAANTGSVRVESPPGTQSPDGIAPPTSNRRRSIIPVEDNHEVCLPISANGVEDKDKSAAAATEPSAVLQTKSPFVCRGGSCIVGPDGSMLKGPLWEVQETKDDPDATLLVSKIDLDDCLRGRLDFDAAGSYSRNDAFKLTVEGLDLYPPE